MLDSKVGFLKTKGCGERESVSEGVTKREENAIERQKDRMRDGVRDRHIDARETARERERPRT